MLGLLLYGFTIAGYAAAITLSRGVALSPQVAYWYDLRHDWLCASLHHAARRPATLFPMGLASAAWHSREKCPSLPDDADLNQNQPAFEHKFRGRAIVHESPAERLTLTFLHYTKMISRKCNRISKQDNVS